jgi:predicted negative regulator of RcsB-dependent stress response
VSKRLETVEQHVEADYRRIEKMEVANKALCRGVMALLCNAETGNSTGTMREAREELQNYLIER